jgi:uncharacterized delta-60 repeat protein
MRGRIGGALAAFALGSAVLAGGAAAAPRPGVVLDPSFGQGGVALLRDTNAYATFGRPLPGGDLLIQGSRNVRLLNSSGGPATAFGAVGSLRPPAATGTRFELTGFTVDAEGRLLVVGESVFPEAENPSPPLENGAKAFYPEEVRMLRYLPGGRLDPSFGNGGVVETDLGLPPPVGEEGESLGPRSSVYATGVAVGPEGRIVVTGDAVAHLGPSCVHDAFAAVGVEAGFLARFTANGAPDPSFGVDGLFGGHDLDENRLGATSTFGPMVGPSGGVTFRSGFGYSCEPRESRSGIGRLTADGETDTAFGEGGAIAGYFPAVVQEADGSVVTMEEVGRYGKDPVTAEVTRIGLDGRPDPSFGNGGRVRVHLPPGLWNNVSSLAIDPGGRIYIGGTLETDKEPASVLLRLSARGKWEKGFGPHGRVVTRIRDLDEAGPSDLFFDRRGRLDAVYLKERSQGRSGLVVARFLPRFIRHGSAQRRRVSARHRPEGGAA